MKLISRKDAREIGLKRYFTGKPCRFGNVAERWTCNHECTCKECMRLRRLLPNGKTRTSKSSSKGRDRIRKWDREYLNKNRVTLNARRRERYQLNQDAIRIRQREYRLKNRAILQPIRLKQSAQRKRRIRAEGSERVTGSDIQQLFNKQYGLCAGCCKSIDGGYDIDHIHALRRGGLHRLTNLQLLCVTCNRRKGAKSVEQWNREKTASLLPYTEPSSGFM